VGLTVLDAGVVIAILDASDAHHAAAVEAVTRAREGGDTLVLLASAYAECLVSPHRRGPEAVAVVDSFVDALPARVEPASRAIAGAAAELRARHAGALRLPDALVVATALVLGADRLLTTDAGWPALPVPVEVLAPSER
jgi:predicted nucleic acid-binding protein